MQILNYRHVLVNRWCVSFVRQITWREWFWFGHFFFPAFLKMCEAVYWEFVIQNWLATEIKFFQTFTTIAVGAVGERNIFIQSANFKACTAARGSFKFSSKSTNRRRHGRRREPELQTVSKATEKSSFSHRTGWHLQTERRWKTMRCVQQTSNQQELVSFRCLVSLPIK